MYFTACLLEENKWERDTKAGFKMFTRAGTAVPPTCCIMLSPFVLWCFALGQVRILRRKKSTSTANLSKPAVITLHFAAKFTLHFGLGSTFCLVIQVSRYTCSSIIRPSVAYCAVFQAKHLSVINPFMHWPCPRAFTHRCMGMWGQLSQDVLDQLNLKTHQLYLSSAFSYMEELCYLFSHIL